MVAQELKAWFAKLTSHSPFFFAILDNQHNYVSVNQRYVDIAGLSNDALVGMNDCHVLGEGMYQHLAPYYNRALQGEIIECEISLTNIDIETTLHISVAPIKINDDTTYIIFQAFDTSEKQVLVRSLSESEEKFATLTRSLIEGFLLIEDETIISANPAMATIFGFENTKDFLGERIDELFSDPRTQSAFKAPLISLLSETPLDCLLSSKCFSERSVSLTAQNTSFLGNEATLVLVNAPSDSLEQETQLIASDPMIDSLTDLYNRAGFTKRLDKFISHNTPCLLLYLDIDNFKNINDSLGHHIGDKVICEVAARLKRLMPSTATIGHLGADEFGIIIPEPDSPNLSDKLAEQIISIINQPFDLNYFSKRLSCSIGSVNYPGDGNDARILLQNADTAMYEAKDRGRNRLIHFNEQMNKEARTRLWLEIELQKALQQSGLEVWYQPKVNARDFSINGAEALVRWKHPVEGYISPGAFIPVAEKAGLIEHLGKVVMREVFTTVKRWKQQGILPGRVAINLSPEQFVNPKLIDYMKKLLRTIQVDPSCITFELTESAVMSDGDHTLQMLNSIKKLGFTLSIDDFGTGYSSLAYLARFPIDELKIDRSFINELDVLPKQVTVIENIINLGKSLNLMVVAEGVETKQQAMLLSSMKCNSIQGFHFHRPQPKHEIEALFAKNRRTNQK
jgi:diguanylate cyclase (GGDEF)-like protein/PAS domain S-box-containing protein